jgi:hypothetical protein
MVPSLSREKFEFRDVAVQIFSYHLDSPFEDCLGVFLFKSIRKISLERSFDRVP